jgi:subtilisin family serine protease
MKKVYTVIIKDASKSEEIHNLLCSHTHDIENIPDDCIECANRKTSSSLRTSYLLTEEQVNILRNNPDIESVELDQNFHPNYNVSIRTNRYASETYSYRTQYYDFYKRGFAVGGTTYYGYIFPWKNMGSSTNTSLRQTYSKIQEYVKESTTNDAQFTVYLNPTNLSDQNSDVISWSKIRTKYKYNPWKNVSSGIISNDNILSERDGSDVDIVIQDVGVDKHHPDFLDSQGNSRVRDIVVDGPQYVDPQYFSNNPSKTYIDWWQNASNRSAQFQSLGTLTVPRYTVLLYVFTGATYANFSSNIGKTITQNVGGVEYTRGTIVDTLDIFGGSWFYIKVQLDLGKPHFRYHSPESAGNPYNGNYPTLGNTPADIKIDPTGSNITEFPPNIASGFVYQTGSVLENNPNNTPVDSTGHYSIATTMSITEATFGNNANAWADGASGGTPPSSALEYDWDTTTNPSTYQGYTLEYKLGLEGRERTHGTHCASESAGKKHGYAPGANIWSIKCPFDGQSWASGSTTIDAEQSFDFIRIFHQAKPNNPTYGNKNPTILSGSWGYNAIPFYEISDGTTINYNYRGNSSTYSFVDSGENPNDLSSTPDFIKTSLYLTKKRLSNAINNTYYQNNSGQNVFTGITVNLSDSAVKSAGEECLNAGVHMCFSAGNANTYVVKDSSDQDYNNSIHNPVFNETLYLHRVGTPSDINGSVNVGALSCTTKTDGTERKDDYSCKGPGVDIYAPALNTISARGFQKHNVNPSVGSEVWYFQYYPNNQKDELYNWFSGTSSACPNVAGVLALFLQKNRIATTQEAKSWLLGTSSSYSTSGSYIDTDISNPTPNNFWGDFSTYTTDISNTINEQTYNVGNVSIVLDANYHIAYSQTAEMLMDTNIKILYNPYASAYYATDTSYSFSVSTSNTNPIEGESILITISTDPSINETYYYNIEEFPGSSISASDFVKNSLSGNFNIINGTGTILLTLAKNPELEGAEKFRVRIHSNSLNGTIVGYSDYITNSDFVSVQTENSLNNTFKILNVNGLTFKNIIFK